MPRTARNKSRSNYYHVMVQGMNKEYIFEKEKYILKYLEILKEKAKEHNIHILGYCIMGNHAHLLIYSKSSKELAKYMQKVNVSYSRFYNEKEKRVGYVFRDRYHTQEILNRKQLLSCLVYIHNNPVKAGIVENIKDYIYSSYNEFFHKKVILSVESVNLLFGDVLKFKNQFYLIHRRFIKEEENFIEVKEIKEKSIETLIEEKERLYQCRIKEIKADKKILEAFIKQARKETDVTIKELAEIVDVSKSTISNYCKK